LLPAEPTAMSPLTCDRLPSDNNCALIIIREAGGGVGIGNGTVVFFSFLQENKTVIAIKMNKYF
jgi:hypothetical protein